MTNTKTVKLTHCQRWTLESLCIAHIWDGAITAADLSTLINNHPIYTTRYLEALRKKRLATVTRRAAGDVWKPLARGLEVAKEFPKVAAALADDAAIRAEAS